MYLPDMVVVSLAYTVPFCDLSRLFMTKQKLDFYWNVTGHGYHVNKGQEPKLYSCIFS